MILIVVEMMHAVAAHVQSMVVLDILQEIYVNVMINALILVIAVMIMKKYVLVMTEDQQVMKYVMMV